MSQGLAVAGIAAALLLIRRLSITVAEQVVVLDGIGYQLRRVSLLGTSNGRFLHADSVRSVVIHEGFERQVWSGAGTS